MILIVDDHEFMRKSLHSILWTYGFPTHLTKNNDEVLQMLIKNPYELVIFGPHYLECLHVLKLDPIIRAIPRKTQVTSVYFVFSKMESDFISRYDYFVYHQLTSDPKDLVRHVQYQLNRQLATV